MADKAKRKSGLGSLQDLIGRMKSVYLNDRSSNRADLLLPMFDEAFEVVVRLRSRAWQKDASK